VSIELHMVYEEDTLCGFWLVWFLLSLPKQEMDHCPSVGWLDAVTSEAYQRWISSRNRRWRRGGWRCKSVKYPREWMPAFFFLRLSNWLSEMRMMMAWDQLW